jgi:hypothetical protein
MTEIGGQSKAFPAGLSLCDRHTLHPGRDRLRLLHRQRFSEPVPGRKTQPPADGGVPVAAVGVGQRLEPGQERLVRGTSKEAPEIGPVPGEGPVRKAARFRRAR